MSASCSVPFRWRLHQLGLRMLTGAPPKRDELCSWETPDSFRAIQSLVVRRNETNSAALLPRFPRRVGCVCWWRHLADEKWLNVFRRHLSFFFNPVWTEAENTTAANFA